MTDDRNDPLEKLAAAHRRLEQSLNDLARAGRALADPTRRGEAIEVVLGVISYLERSILRHEEDEERSLFPRLLVFEATGPTIARLRQAHVAHGRAVDGLRAAIAQDGGASAPNTLPTLIEDLTSSYKQHIACEEQEIFPAARRFLQASVLYAINAEMESRRGRGAGANGARSSGGRGSRPGGPRRGP